MREGAAAITAAFPPLTVRCKVLWEKGAPGSQAMGGSHIVGKANRRVSGSHSGSHSVLPHCLAAAVDGARAFLERSKRAFPERKDDLGFMPTHSSSQEVGGDFGEWLSFRGACVIGLPPWNNVFSVLASPFPHSSQRRCVWQ